MPPEERPKGQLGCIPCSTKSKLITPVLRPAKAEPPVNICKYSSFSKLISVTTKLFIVVFRFKKFNAGPVEAATNYLIEWMQKEIFSVELSYLSSPNTNCEVSQLNCF